MKQQAKTIEQVLDLSKKQGLKRPTIRAYKKKNGHVEHCLFNEGISRFVSHNSLDSLFSAINEHDDLDWMNNPRK